jgi:hypothetical protein
MYDPIVGGGIEVEEGLAAAPLTPGIGVEFAPEALARGFVERVA